jgi:hypothetical protein
MQNGSRVGGEDCRTAGYIREYYEKASLIIYTYQTDDIRHKNENFFEKFFAYLKKA